MSETDTDFTGIKALFFNGTLKRSPEASNTEGLLRSAMHLMESKGATTELIRTIDHDIAVGVQPDMTEHGWKTDAWPSIFEKVRQADIVIVCGPIWLGDNSSETKKTYRTTVCNVSNGERKRSVHILRQSGWMYYNRQRRRHQTLCYEYSL